MYYLRVHTPVVGNVYKIGITNRTVEDRFNNDDLDKINVLKTWHFKV